MSDKSITTAREFQATFWGDCWKCREQNRVVGVTTKLCRPCYEAISSSTKPSASVDEKEKRREGAASPSGVSDSDWTDIATEDMSVVYPLSSSSSNSSSISNSNSISNSSSSSRAPRRGERKPESEVEATAEIPEIEELLETYRLGSVAPVPIQIPPLPASYLKRNDSKLVKDIYEFFCLDHGLRVSVEDREPVPFGRTWVIQNLHLRSGEGRHVSRILEYLVKEGVLKSPDKIWTPSGRQVNCYLPGEKHGADSAPALAEGTREGNNGPMSCADVPRLQSEQL